MSESTALVTGGSGGIGRAVVEGLVAGGYTVAFTYREHSAEAQAIVAASSGRAHGFPFDLRDLAAAEELVSRVEEACGPVDALVNNAGVRTEGLLAMTSDDEWSRVVETNLGGMFRVCRAVLPGMLRRRRGAVVNVTSLAAIHGMAGQSVYAASKAGIVGMTKALAREVGKRRVRVNAVAPGYVPTRMTADLPDDVVTRLRAGECLPGGVTTESVAQTVLFLLSDRAASITGQCLIVDAGVSA